MAEELFREQAGSAASAKESPRSSSEREEGGQLTRDRSDRWADIYEDMPVRWLDIFVLKLLFPSDKFQVLKA